MNRFKNEQRMQIIEFYYQMRNLLRKFITRNVTVNSERYREITSNFFLPKMQELDWHDVWFQRDGATCHTARVTMGLMRGDFGEHFIPRSGPVI